MSTMDPAQIILLLVVIILTVILVVLGIQVFYVLRELRGTLVKTNKILDRANQFTENISNPINTISSVLSGVKTGNLIASIFKKINSKEKGENNGKQ